MRPYQPRRIAAGVLAALFTLCVSAVPEARGQAGAGKRARAAAGSRQGRAQPREADERARALLEEGHRHADAGKWEEALRAYRQALAIDPRYGEAYIDMGDAYMSSGKYKEGVAAYEQAIGVAPSNPDAHYSLGAAYNDMANYGDAFKPFVRAIQLDPGFAEAHYGIGYAYLRLENFRDALVYLRRAVQLKPDYAEARLALGQTQLGLRNVRAAEGELKVLADLDASAARVLEKDIREAAAHMQDVAQPAAPARGEQAAARPGPKPATQGSALTNPGEGVPRQHAQAPAAQPKGAQGTAAAPPRRQTGLADAAQTQSTAFELSFWESIKNSGEPEEFAAYIRKYPDGQFVELARIRMRALEAKRGAAKGAEATPAAEVAEITAATTTEDLTQQQAAPAPAQPSPEPVRPPAPQQTLGPSTQQTPAPATQQTPTPSTKQTSPAATQQPPAQTAQRTFAPAAQRPPAPTTQQPSAPAAQRLPVPAAQQQLAPAAQQSTPAAAEPAPASAERPARPSAGQPSSLTESQPPKSSTEQPAQVAAVAQPSKETTASQPLKEAAAKEKEEPAEEPTAGERPAKEPATTEQPVKEAPTREQPPAGEKRSAAGRTNGAGAVTTAEDAASLLRKLFPSRFTYRIKAAGGAANAPAASEVSVNYEPLYFEGCRISWRDSNDTLSVSLSDLDAGAVTVSRRVRPSTTFSAEVWDVTIATEGGRGAISEEKGDGSGAVNVYNGLDLQYESRQKADGVAEALRHAIRLCTGKM